MGSCRRSFVDLKESCRIARGRALASILVVAVGNATPWSPVIDAQGAHLKQEAEVPGQDLWLKSGWQVLFHQSCRFAVPVSWRAEAEGSLATAPDGSNISVRMFKITSWSAHKLLIKRAFGRVNVVHEDSERRLWFEIGEKPHVQHYVDVVNGLSVCVALFEIRPTTTPDADDTTRRIAESIRQAPEEWPPDALK